MSKDELIETTDENGNKITFELLDIVTVDDVEYALLYPTDEEGNHEEADELDEEEVVVMRIKRDGEEYSFETIEDDDEFEKVASYIEELENEIEDEV